MKVNIGITKDSLTAIFCWMSYFKFHTFKLRVKYTVYGNWRVGWSQTYFDGLHMNIFIGCDDNIYRKSVKL